MLKISVILTTYNSSETIERAVQSVRNQVGINKDFEVELLVVDDQSTDTTREILARLHQPFLVNEANSGGPNTGRNKGLRNATGDFIAIMDHDDEWMPDRLQKVLPYLDNAPIISAGYILRDSSMGRDEARYCSGSAFKTFGKNDTFLNKLSRSKAMQNVYLGGLLYHKSLANVLFEETYGMVDFDWLLRLFHGQSSIEVCQPVFIRHVQGANLSLNETYRKRDFELSLKAIKSFNTDYPEQSKLGAKRLHGSLARYYYLVGNVVQARELLRQADLSATNIAYYLTTYFGHNYVRRNFRIFG
jgi:glycosyltransferase involved in cell wall biosynthesis